MVARITSGPRSDRVPWAGLYRLGGVAALLAAVAMRRNLGAEVSLITGRMPPVEPGDWLHLLGANPLEGLAFLGAFDLINYALVGLLLLALSVALWRTAPGAMAVVLGLAAVGVAVYVASNQAVAMLNLSRRYAAAAEAQRASILAAMEALLAANNPGSATSGTGAHAGLLGLTLAGLLVSVAMLRDAFFGRLPAVLGILAHLLVLAYWPVLILAPDWGWLPHTAAALPLIAWQALAGLRLLRGAGDLSAPSGALRGQVAPDR